MGEGTFEGAWSVTRYKAERWTPLVTGRVGGAATTETEKRGHASRLQEGKAMMSRLGNVDFVSGTANGP